MRSVSPSLLLQLLKEATIVNCTTQQDAPGRPLHIVVLFRYIYPVRKSQATEVGVRLSGVSPASEVENTCQHQGGAKER